LYGLDNALIVRVDDEVFVAVAVRYRAKNTQFDGDELCPTDVAAAGSPTFAKSYRFPLAVKDDAYAPVCGGVDPEAYG